MVALPLQNTVAQEHLQLLCQEFTQIELLLDVPNAEIVEAITRQIVQLIHWLNTASTLTQSNADVEKLDRLIEETRFTVNALRRYAVPN